MLRNDKNLSETDIRTEGSEMAFLVASLADKRPWLKTGTLCKSLERHKMLHLGVAKMVPPFEIVRMKLGGTYFLAGLGGEGRVIVDGRWKTCSPGQAFLLPPGTLHAFEAMPRQDWEFCWIRFQEDLPGQPIADANSPVLASFDGRPLRHAILGLHEEAKGPARGEMEAHWLDLIFRHIQIFAGPHQLDPRLQQLFKEVGETIGQAWENQKMAAKACLSERQLERLCIRQLGRTPRQHLIWLRMHRAAAMLAQGELKIEAIAHEVGYSNPFVFSSTFKRCMGWAPSEYPRRVMATQLTSKPAPSSS